jgi:hypothetical protein
LFDSDVQQIATGSGIEEESKGLYYYPITSEAVSVNNFEKAVLVHAPGNCPTSCHCSDHSRTTKVVNEIKRPVI